MQQDNRVEAIIHMKEKQYEELLQAQERIRVLEEENAALLAKVNRIRRNPLWKVTRPIRIPLSRFLQLMRRVRRLGGPRAVMSKLKYKMREKNVGKYFGSLSFPSDQEREEIKKQTENWNIRISILTPLYNTSRVFLRDMLDSVMNQTLTTWELCLADGSDDAHTYVGEICQEYVQKSDGRIKYQKLLKNEGISGNTNECIKMASGEYIGLLDHDDILHPNALYEYVKAILTKGADYLYCDELTFHGRKVERTRTIHFKPDFAPDNLLANNYICHFSVFARKLLGDGLVFRSQFDGSQDHDMILRLTDAANQIVHIPKILYYWRSHAGSVASGIEAKTYAIDSARAAISEHLTKHGFKDFRVSSTKAFETIFRIQYALLSHPLISIIIPNKDHSKDLRRAVSSILSKSTYPDFEIIIVENNSSWSNSAKEESVFTFYEELLGEPFESKVTGNIQRSKDGRIAIVQYEGVFNYSAINQVGVEAAQGEYLLFLNNDTQVITGNWMEEMLMYAQRDDVGAVGAKLYYEDRTIQHAGVILGMGAHKTAGHCHYKVSAANFGYMGRLSYAQNLSAVTGACLMIQKAKYAQVGGLDTAFAVSLNDVDLCLKLRSAGYLNIFTPFAELYHFESASRGADTAGAALERYNEESKRFREKWQAVLEAGDPYFNPNFSLERSDFAIKTVES